MIDPMTAIKAIPAHWKGALATVVALLLLSGSVLISPAFAQIPKLFNITRPDSQESETKPKTVSPEQQRDTTKKELAKTQAERDLALAASANSSNQDLQEKNRLLDGLVSRLNTQINLIAERESLRLARTAAEQKAKNWAEFPTPPPYSILMVDEIMGSVLTARDKLRGLSTNQELFARQVTQYRESTKQAREKERQASDELERAKSSEERLSASWQKELAALRTRSATAMAELMALRYEVLGERLAVAGVELELLERQLTEARKRMVFSRADLNKALGRLKSGRIILEQELEASLVRDARTRKVLAQTQQELDSFTLRHGKGGKSAMMVARHDVLEARQRAALAWVESSRFESEVVSALIAINKSNAAFWEQRYTAATGTDIGKRREIMAGLRKSVEQLKPWLVFAQQQLELYLAAEHEQESHLLEINTHSQLRVAERDLLAARSLQRVLAERQKAAVEQAAIERQSWLEDLERIQQSHNITDRIRDWFRAFPEIFEKVWRFELFSIEDSVEVAGQRVVTSRGVTVGKSVGAILLFLVGYWIAAFLGRRIQRIMIASFGVGEHQANVIRRWLLALTTFILMIITLNLARIPLTVFAFLGGALAIGVGFGTQTLIKNFISGILILLERNVKVGDTIDVDGVVGRIVTVDIRASTVLGFDGVETVIPNSMFLEKKVTNWTHTNTKLRRIVKVGVSYGSPTTMVRDILEECGKEHGLILDEPAPAAIFEDFGDSALIFALYFWVDYGPGVNPMQVASDLRFMIDKRFAEEKIVLAFPQRDVHFDSAQPLRVEMVCPPLNDGSE